MKRLYDGTIVMKEFKDMTEEELLAVDILSLSDAEYDELSKWLNIREKEKWDPLQI